MLPIVINWVAASNTNICAVQGFVDDVALQFINPIPVQNTFATGQQAFSSQPVYQNGMANYVNNLPKIYNNASTGVPNLNEGPVTYSAKVGLNQAQKININLTGPALTMTVTITGLDQNNTSQTENITVIASTLARSSNFYTTINSVVPSQSAPSGNLLSVGTSGIGQTAFPMLDVYNKSSLYTISYTNVTNQIAITPVYYVGQMMYFVNRQQQFSHISSANWFTLPIANNNVIISTNLGAPITAFPEVLGANQYASFSISGIPLTSLGTSVSQGTGSFTQTIIQQGAHF